MEDKSVIITGANSYLGSNLVRYLIEQTQWRIYAVVSHRTRESLPGLADPRVTVLQADLTQALPKSISRVVDHVSRIVHFAWTRSQRLDEACTLNRRMIESVLERLSDRSNLIFISSVAASPSARSVYGRAKFDLAQYAIRQGGVAVVCGLVTDNPPHGPYALLTHFVRYLPLRLRFTDEGPLVYPIGIDLVSARLAASLEMKLESGTYKLWESPVRLNLFLASIEREFPRRRVLVPANTRALLAIASLIGRLRLPAAGWIDKAITLLHKDEAYLGSLPELLHAVSSLRQRGAPGWS